MMRKALLTILSFILISLQLVGTSVFPHHHHNNGKVVCFLNDNVEKDCCNDSCEHKSGEDCSGSNCLIGSNLIIAKHQTNKSDIATSVVILLFLLPNIVVFIFSKGQKRKRLYTHHGTDKLLKQVMPSMSMRAPPLI